MADDTPLVLPEQGQPSGAPGVWDDLVNDAFRALETRVNTLRQYVLDNPGGGGDDATIAALVADTNSATYDAVVALILSQGVTPTLTVSSITDITLAATRTFLQAANLDDAHAALGVPSVTDLTDAVAALNSALAGKSQVGHGHSAGQVTGLATVATSGSYSDLANKPTIPGADITTAAPGQVFFRQWVGGAWEPRGSNRTDVMVLWLANGSGQALPAEAVDSLDQLLS
jgi:hypothetical protein